MKNGLQEGYYKDGSISSRHWYNNGELHKEDGPAEIRYYEDGSIHSQFWCINGSRHREDGPAAIHYHKDSSTHSQRWYINGKLHREDGPASIYYNEDGSMRSQYWYKDGKELTKIPREMLIAYMKTSSLTLAELLLDNDDLVRTSTQSHRWKNTAP